MDPLSMAASIIAVVQMTGTVLGYLNDVKDASKDRDRLAIEASSVYGLLTCLAYRIKAANPDDPWFTAVRMLGTENGPLDQFKQILQSIASKLGPTTTGFEKVRKSLIWKFEKKEVNACLIHIERLKSLVGLALANDHFSLTLALKQDISLVNQGISGLTVQLEQLRVDQQSQMDHDLIDWISPLDFQSRQREIFEKRMAGTGQWLLDSTEFRAWRDDNCQVLWCPGIPGAGKTILASVVVNHLQQTTDEEIATICLYCNFQERAEQTTINLVASLLKQLLQKRASISKNVRAFYDTHAKASVRPTLDKWMTLLQAEIQGFFSRVYVVVDALDECEEQVRTSLLASLQSLSTISNLMLTSRYHALTAGDLSGRVQLNIAAHAEDVDRYLQTRIPREHRLARHIKTDPDLFELMVGRIASSAQGMFLLAKLHLDALVCKNNLRAIRLALQQLPSGLNATYDMAMTRIEEQGQEDWELAKAVLSWIVFAYQPLSIGQLQHALAISPDDRVMCLDACTDEDTLLSVCGGLVDVDGESQIVRLVHYTAQEYFNQIRESRFQNAQVYIASTCLRYLSFDNICASSVTLTENHHHLMKDLDKMMDQHVLLRYAARYWGEHLRGKGEEAITEQVISFLEDKQRTLCATQILLQLMGNWSGDWDKPTKTGFSGMHAAGFFGLAYIIQQMIQCGAPVDNVDAWNRTPFSWAAQQGQMAAVRLLMERDEVQLDCKSNVGQTPLSRAAAEGQVDIVRLLIQRPEVEVDSRGVMNRSPLSWAAAHGHGVVVSLFLSRDDVDVNSKDTLGNTPLRRAVDFNHYRVVMLLLDDPRIDVNSKDNDGRTPLARAASLGLIDLTGSFLEYSGTDVNSANNAGQTPLVEAAITGRLRIVQMLLSYPAVLPDARGTANRNALSWAAAHGHVPIVKVLLKLADAHGTVETDPKDTWGWTPLWRAVNGQHAEVVKLFLHRADVDINAEDNNGTTPLMEAERLGNLEIAALLRDAARLRDPNTAS